MSIIIFTQSATAARCCCTVALSVLLIILLGVVAAAAAFRHRVADVKNCCWLIKSDSTLFFFLFIPTRYMF